MVVSSLSCGPHHRAEALNVWEQPTGGFWSALSASCESRLKCSFWRNYFFVDSPLPFGPNWSPEPPHVRLGVITTLGGMNSSSFHVYENVAVLTIFNPSLATVRALLQYAITYLLWLLSGVPFSFPQCCQNQVQPQISE